MSGPGLNGTELATLSAAEKRERARKMARDDGTLTGADLDRLFGMKDRWGRKQAAAARGGTEAARPSGTRQPTPARAATAHTGTNGTAPAARDSAVPARQTARAAMPTEPRPETVPPLLLGLTVLSVATVTVVCAVVNYFHVRDLATLAGMGGLAGWLPLGVDGLVVASTCSVIADRHLKQPVEALAVIGVILGLAGSLAANVLAVDPDLVSLRAVRWVLAGYSPAALAVSVHLMIRMLGANGKATA